MRKFVYDILRKYYMLYLSKVNNITGNYIIKQGRKRPLDTRKRKIERRERERSEREGERERVKGIDKERVEVKFT